VDCGKLKIGQGAFDNMAEFRYTVSLQGSPEGFSVWVPGLPGCASQGRTETEALDNIRDAINEYLSVADELSGTVEKREVVLQR
jgi:predicted RNase H-like HicB family nuclease